ncbi:MAG: tyrosine-protein phosphatase [Alphaproteobacteria bacterium]|nr:tyrosine-protein phosphatase [Alphaproteobacteria bacterium]
MRRYLPHAIENMRDVGGYPTSNNQTVAYRQIIRSNVPLNLTKTDIQHLKEIGINTIVDLRAEAEYLRKKPVFEDTKEFEVIHLPIQQGSEIPPSLEAVPLSYLSMLEEKENISKFFKLIAEPNRRVLFFCNAGKDRTGVFTALLLMLLGVKDEDIIADYLLSAIYMRRILLEFGKTTDANTYSIITPRIENMEKFMELFKEKYNSIENYLFSIGITEENIRNIRSKLLV